LIPFPAAPAIRKVSDQTFAHLAAALSPPEVNVHLYDPQRIVMRSTMDKMPSMMSGVAEAESDAGPPLRIDEVRVVNQEAVGMYEVAVLAAGSPKALRGWMEDHEFRYPDGMETTIGDYVDSQWFFVAVKAKVGKESGISPRPGMRGVDTSFPSGGQFDGHVQAMGFRFPAEKPVIPMRLSVFNGDDTRNLIYMLSEEPVRVRGVRESLVVRQLAGERLYQNLTAPLDLRISGGTESQITGEWRKQVRALRDPTPYNGIAADLIRSDLLASRQDTLSLDFEEQEKELLRISESLGLRGDAIDTLHTEVTTQELSRNGSKRLRDLHGMTLTVIDGDFPQAHLADENLQFLSYRMDDAKNDESNYNRRPAGPSISVPIQVEEPNSIFPW